MLVLAKLQYIIPRDLKIKDSYEGWLLNIYNYKKSKSFDHCRI